MCNAHPIQRRRLCFYFPCKAISWSNFVPNWKEFNAWLSSDKLERWKFNDERKLNQKKVFGALSAMKFNCKNYNSRFDVMLVKFNWSGVNRDFTWTHAPTLLTQFAAKYWTPNFWVGSEGVTSVVKKNLASLKLTLQTKAKFPSFPGQANNAQHVKSYHH